MVTLLIPSGLLLMFIYLYFVFKHEKNSIMRWLHLFCLVSFIGFISITISLLYDYDFNNYLLLQLLAFCLFYLWISLLVVISIISIIKIFKFLTNKSK